MHQKVEVAALLEVRTGCDPCTGRAGGYLGESAVSHKFIG